MRRFDRKGQSLVELIVAIAVIEIGIFSVWSLFLINFNAEREAEMRIVGVNLAREGVEVMKNIRDSNWLKNSNNKLMNSSDPSSIWTWDRYLDAGTYYVNFDSTEPSKTDLGQLYANSEGFYSYNSSDQPTPYRRTVTLSDLCCDDADTNFKCDSASYVAVAANGACPLKVGVDVVCDVTWQISGKQRHAVVEDKMYDWK